MSEKLKILIADDSPTVATYLKMALERKGYEILMAKNGIEAAEKIYQMRPDLVVSDVMMPRLTGYQVCRLLKGDESIKDTPVILLTSLDEKMDVFWGLKSGADLYLTKGSNIKTLVMEIEKFIKKKKLTTAAKEKGEKALTTREGSDITDLVINLLEKNLFESTLINEIGELVNTLEDYRKTMLSVLKIFSKVIDSDLGLILLIDEESRECYFSINGLISRKFIDSAHSLANDFLFKTIKLQSYPSECLMEIDDPEKSLLEKGDMNNSDVGSHHLKLLQTKGVPSGLIGLFSLKSEAFSSRIMETFDIVALQANLVIDYARLYEKNKQLSITDGLTKVYNHRYFQESLKKEFARSSRYQTGLSLVILDIDHFKKINDSYGHQQGDKILSELCRILKNSLRSLDTIARYGGEEFTIIMPGTNQNEALKVAERLRKTVEEHEFSNEDKPIKVTVSLGVASLPNPIICNPNQLISSADYALYGAKNKGRNRVEVAPPAET